MTRTLFTARIAGAAVLAAIGAAACLGGFGYGIEGEDGAIGSGLLPAATGAIVAVLALVDLAQTLAKARSTEAADSTEDAATDGTDVLGRTPQRRNRNLVTVMVLVFVAAALVPLVGLLLAMGLLMVAIAIAVEGRRPLPSIAVTAVALACVWLVFAQGLSVPFPTGLLGLV